MTDTAPFAFFHDATVDAHAPPPGHPERPERVQNTLRVLEESGILRGMTRPAVVPASREQLLRVHSPAMLDRIERTARRGGGLLDGGDTHAAPGSWDAARCASGAAAGAVDAVMKGAGGAFSLMRPPGHHATPSQSMGFCLVNHAAVAAAHAVEVHGLSRVCIVDFDVHHGNGTQDCFYADGSVLYVSTHQSPAYPGTGAVPEMGTGDGAGTTVNVPLPADVGDDGFCAAFDRVVLPVVQRFRPQLVIASAGYDAHWRNAAYVQGIRERVTVRGLAALSARIKQMADACCPGRLVGILEGGYDLDALAGGVLATLQVWTGDSADVQDPIGPPPSAVPEPDITPLLNSICRLHGL